MSESPLHTAHQSIQDGVAALRAALNSACLDERVSGLVICEQLTRQVDQLSTELLAGLDRDGVFADRGYSRPAPAVADLLSWDAAVAGRRVRVAEQVVERVGLDGQVLPARLPATAAVFTAGETSLRHVEVVADALGSAAAGRLTPQGWAGAEEQLAEWSRLYRPRELAGLARDLIATLDQDGAAPDDDDTAAQRAAPGPKPDRRGPDPSRAGRIHLRHDRRRAGQPDPPHDRRPADPGAAPSGRAR